MGSPPSRPEAKIQVEHLTKRFGDKLAVSDLNLSIASGEIFAFLGPNGAGKTTTIKIMAGLLRPTEGTVRIAGHDVVKEPEAAKARMAYIPDEPFLYDKLTGREFLLFVGELYGMSREDMVNAIQSLAERFEFASYMDELCESYSHGMAQRIVVASALMHRPEVVLIDEPFVGLDPRSSRTLKDALRELASGGAAILLSTHMLDVAYELAHRVGVIHRGHLIACASPSELAAGTRQMEDVFLELTSGTG